MVVGVDQTGHQHAAAQINDSICRFRQLITDIHLLDNAIPGKQAAIGDFALLIIHRKQHVGVAQ